MNAGAAAGVNVQRPPRVTMRNDVEARPASALALLAGEGPVGACGGRGGWVGRGQDKQDPANSESVT